MAPPTLAVLIFSASPFCSSAADAASRTTAWNDSVARDEIGLGIDFDHGALRARRGNADQTFGGDAAGLLRGLRQTLLTEPIHRRFDVAVVLGQRLLAVHHAGAGLLAKLLHQRSRNLGHALTPHKVRGCGRALPAAWARSIQRRREPAQAQRQPYSADAFFLALARRGPLAKRRLARGLVGGGRAIGGRAASADFSLASPATASSPGCSVSPTSTPDATISAWMPSITAPASRSQ